MTRLVISAAVDPGPAHDRIRVWVRGQNVGSLTVGAGDGEAVASRLVRLGLEQGERIESESGSVHFSEPAEDCLEWTPEERAALQEQIAAALRRQVTARFVEVPREPEPRRISATTPGAVICSECCGVCHCECSHVREAFDREAWLAARCPGCGADPGFCSPTCSWRSREDGPR